MTAGLNRAYLVGTLGAEPELRTGLNGSPFARLSIATPNARKVDGDWIDTPDWHRVTVAGALVEAVKGAAKGSAIAVECAIRPSRWTDANGHIHHEVTLVVERILALNGAR